MALEITSRISVDLKRPNAEIVNAVQYDSSDVIEIQLLNDGKKYFVPNGVLIAVLYKKSDRIGGYYDKLTINNEAAVSINSFDRSIIYVRLDIQTTTTSGNVDMQVAFFEGKKRLTTFSFLLKVQSSPLSFADITSRWIFNALMETHLIVDKTLQISDAAADAKVVGDLVFAKVNKPVGSPNGTAGQLLRTNGDGTTVWTTYGLPTDAQTSTAITNWLNNHPEATTTVQDGSITILKMHPDLQPALNIVLDIVEVTS